MTKCIELLKKLGIILMTQKCLVIEISEKYNYFNYVQSMSVIYVFMCEYTVYLEGYKPK